MFLWCYKKFQDQALSKNSIISVKWGKCRQICNKKWPQRDKDGLIYCHALKTKQAEKNNSRI